MIQFDLPKHQSSIIKVIGVGGGGGNAVNYMYRKGICDVDFVVCNTDLQVLNQSPVPLKIQLGPTISEGRGAGASPDKGRQAALESLDKIKELLSHNTKMVFITAGMGGGTGTGAAPIIAQAAKELNILTVAIVTLPFVWEGRSRIIRACDGIRELRKYVDAMLVINNQKILRGESRDYITAFAEVDEILATAAKGIAEIITIPGIMNVDFEDVNTVMQNSGVFLMGSGAASGEDRVRKALEQAIYSPLLDDINIFGAKNILVNAINGKALYQDQELNFLMNFLQTNAGLNAEIIIGITHDNNLDEEIALTVIATGFSDEVIPELYVQKVQEVYQVNLHGAESSLTQAEKPVETTVLKPQELITSKINAQTKETIKSEPGQITMKIKEDNNQVQVTPVEQIAEKPKMASSKQIIAEPLKSSEPAYPVDSKVIDEYEKIPAIERRKGKIDPNYKETTNDKEVSRFRISLDETDELILREASPYLDKNVD